jgi:hypothetical protein
MPSEHRIRLSTGVEPDAARFRGRRGHDAPSGNARATPSTAGRRTASRSARAKKYPSPLSLGPSVFQQASLRWATKAQEKRRGQPRVRRRFLQRQVQRGPGRILRAHLRENFEEHSQGILAFVFLAYGWRPHRQHALDIISGL